MVELGTEEDNIIPLVALLDVEEMTVIDPVRRLVGKQMPSVTQPIVVTNFAATPVSRARLGQHLEDDGNPISLE